MIECRRVVAARPAPGAGLAYARYEVSMSRVDESLDGARVPNDAFPPVPDIPTVCTMRTTITPMRVGLASPASKSEGPRRRRDSWESAHFVEDGTLEPGGMTSDFNSSSVPSVISASQVCFRSLLSPELSKM